MLAALALLATAPVAAAAASRSTPTTTTAPVQWPSGAPGTFGAASVITLPSGVRPSSLGYLYRELAQRRVTSGVLYDAIDVIEFRVGNHPYAAQFVPTTDAGLQSRLLAAGVDLRVSTATTLSASADTSGSGGSSVWVPVLVIMAAVALIGFDHHRRRRRLFGATAHRKRRAAAGVQNVDGSVSSDVPGTTFDEVAGADEAKEDLREIVEYLRHPERFNRLGVRQPKGALLVGPPGTGKTLLARAVAGEAKVPFFAVSGADFAEMFVGVGAQRVRNLFSRARKAKRAIVFIDEVDAVARRRSEHATSPADSERDATLIALLNEMDGFAHSNVIVLAATNRADILDPALTRPGRLDRRIEVPPPDRRGRLRILEVHAASRPLAPGVDLDAVARRTAGMSGADLANVVNEAAMLAAREDAAAVTADHFDGAVMTVLMGRARTSAVVTDADRRVTAWHEAGHAVCAFMQEAADAPVSVSIVPRGPAGGVTAMAQDDDHFLRRSKAGAQLVTALGGRAAERLLLDEDFTQGAAGDLEKATQLATAMAVHYGMTELGLMTRDPHRHGPSVIEGVPAIVEALLTRALAEAERLLAAHRDFVERLADRLLDDDTVDGFALAALYAELGSPPRVDSATTLHALFVTPELS